MATLKQMYDDLLVFHEGNVNMTDEAIEDTRKRFFAGSKDSKQLIRAKSISQLWKELSKLWQ